MWVTSGAEVVLIIVILFLVGIGYGGFLIGQSDFKQQAIGHGYAEYCSDTGNWSWIGECE